RLVGAAMKADDGVLITLVLQFALLSLLAVGGINAVIPEMHRQVVDLHQWMTDERFGELYAISQAAPGPNVMVVALITNRSAARSVQSSR
ncbi:MAG TPA: chromate transporter, partial [Rhodoplanes sp.]|nr:chromate transporter [Rhodoplanes sp.]